MTKTKRWKPLEDDIFFSVGQHGSVECWAYSKTSEVCKYLLRFYNCFRTKKEALAASKRVKKALKGDAI